MTGRARSLRSTLLIAFGAVILTTALVSVGVLVAGLRSSLNAWQFGRGAQITERVVHELESLARDDQTAAPLDLQRALRGFLAPGVALRVYDRGGLLVFGYQSGRVFINRARMRSGASGAIHDRPAPWLRQTRDVPAGVPLRIDPQNVPEELRRVRDPETGRVFAYVRAASEGFLRDQTNRALFRSASLALGIGLVAAIAASILIAYVTSRRIATHARGLSDRLTRLAAGSRDLDFPREGEAELQGISRSAAELQDRLSRDEMARIQWTQDVAHDLRTPITALRAQLEAIRDGVFEADERHLRTMLAELDRMEHLVNELRELSRLESPDLTVRSAPMRSGEVLSQAAERFAIVAQERGLAIEIVPAEHEFSGDRELVVRAFSNLVDNAVKHSRTPGVVRLSAACDTIEQPDGRIGHMVSLVVESPGSLPADAEQLFDRLRRGDYARRTAGSGLGLTIARAVARAHGGDVELSQVEPTSISSRKDAGPVVRARIMLPNASSPDRGQ
ncbi:MAG: sensor histidine kinase [Spirochaetota bacterium]